LASCEKCCGRREIHVLVDVGAHGLGALGLVAVEPCQRGVERVEFVEWVKTFIGDDADAGSISGQWNQPDPIALAHQVIGRQATGVFVAGPPGEIIRPVIGVDGVVDSEPRRVHVVAIGTDQVELLLEK